MPWRTFGASVIGNDDQALVELSRNLSGSRPRELYDDEQEEMEAFAAEDRAAVEEAAEKVGFVIVANETTRDALMAAVRGRRRFLRRVDSRRRRRRRRRRRGCGSRAATRWWRRRNARDARRVGRSARWTTFTTCSGPGGKDVPITPTTAWADIERSLAGERAWIKCVGGSSGGGGGGVEGDGPDHPSGTRGRTSKPKETYRADAEAVFEAYVQKLKRREAEAREAMEDGEAMDEGVYDAQDDEDVAVELRRRRERDDLSDELDGRGEKRDRRR